MNYSELGKFILNYAVQSVIVQKPYSEIPYCLKMIMIKFFSI